MRKVLITCALLLACTGCCNTLSREAAYHDGVKNAVLESGLLDEYEAYLAADPVIKDRTKEIRKGTSTKFRELIAEEEKALTKKKD